jgi:hypothetical protein
MRNKAMPNTAKPKYEPTEQNAIGKPASPEPRLSTLTAKKAGATVSREHQDKASGCAPSMEATGTAVGDFFTGGLLGFPIDKDRLVFTASIVRGTKPRDQIETMLVTQMAAVHMAITRFTHRLAHPGNLPEEESAERALNRLARTFAAQIEAFNRHRSGGGQNVTVQNVSISEGSQAIVGNVTHSAGEIAPKETAGSPSALADSRKQATPIDEPARTPVSAQSQGKQMK